MITAGNATLWMHAGEIHEHDTRGALVRMWRFKHGAWDVRDGWGDLWRRGERPMTVDLSLVQKLEAA